MNNVSFLEQFYENVILVRYKDHISLNDIQWIDHGRIEDSYVHGHYFKSNGEQYILLSNDYMKGSYLDDGLSHEIVRIGDSTSIELNFNDNKEIDDITGRYTLYREIKH